MDKQAIKAFFAGRFGQFYSKFINTGMKKLNGDEYQAKCPFHDDKVPSLSINAATGAFYCHGCKSSGSFVDFYAKLNNLDTKRDFKKALAGIAGDFGIHGGNGSKQQAVKSVVVKRYDYLDEAGKLVYQTERLEPGRDGKKKDFRIRRPDGNGGWIYKKEDTRIIPYHLPEILTSTEIIICEGEKDADNLASLGAVTTTNPFGAGKWPDHFRPHFAGKRIVLIPDNDDPGREHMKKVAANLKGYAASVKWIDLPDLPEKGDASDWLDRYQDREAAAEHLALMIEGAPEYIEEAQETPGEGILHDNAREYEPSKQYTHEDAVINSAGFQAINLPARAIYLHPIIQASQIILVSGWRGTGKTWFAMSLADAISRGEPFGPWQVRQPATCLYLDGEMAVGDIKSRLKALNLDENRVNPLYLYSDAYANHLGLSRANLVAESWRSTMKRILVTRGVKVFIVDNIASLASGLDENAKRDWDPINSWLIDLRFNGVTSILLHHTAKDGGQRGTSAREDNIDLSIILKHPRDYVPENGADFVLTFSKTRLPWDDLKHVQDIRFTLKQDETGRAVWSWGFMKAEIRQEVVRMLQEGIPNKEIAEQLGITPGRVSQIKGQIKQEAAV